MAVFSGPEIVNDGLAICLDAGNNKSYPGSGTAWSDLSGNGSNFTLYNGPTYSSTNSGSFVFDGVNDFALAAYTLPTSALSVSAWVYDTDTAGGFRFIATCSSQFIFRIDSDAEGGNLSAFVFIGGSPEPRISASWTKNVWTNIAFTWNTNGNFRIFKNGALWNSSTTRSGTLMSTSPSYLTMGESWKGNISNMLVYNKTLTDAEVLQNFNALRGRYGI